MNKSLSRLSAIGVSSFRQVAGASAFRWQHAEAIRRDLKPIHEHKSIPDGMEGIADGIDDLNESLVFSSTKIGEVLQVKETEWRERNGAIQTKERLPIVFVSEDNTVFEAIKMMTENKIGAVLVRSDDKPDSQFTGILTERDYMNKVALNGFNSRTTKVGRIMTSNPVTVRWDETVLVGLKKMTKGRFRHIPVTQSGKIVGILSLGDLVKNLLNSFKDSVDYLSEYIGGTGVAGKDETLLTHHKTES